MIRKPTIRLVSHINPNPFFFMMDHSLKWIRNYFYYGYWLWYAFPMEGRGAEGRG